MNGDELRQRIQRLGMTYTRASGLLGLSLNGLQQQMRNERAVSRQTTLLLEKLEQSPGEPREAAGTRLRQG